MPDSLLATAWLDATLWLTAAAIFGLLLLSAFFSASETALTAASRGKLRAQADKGSRGAATALEVKQDDERMIGALLLGNNVVNITAASLATAVMTRVFGATGVAVATLAMTLLVLVFGEVLPKTVAITIPESAAARVAPFVRLLMWLFGPVIGLIGGLVRGVLGLFGVRTDPNRHVLSVHEEIAGAIALGHSAGAMEKEDRDRLLGALDLAHRTVSEIMRHRSQIEMVDADRQPAEIIAQVLASPHTRLPVFRGADDNILGVIHAKELLRSMDRLLRSEHGDWAALRDLDVLEVAMPPYFVPKTTPLDEQMRQFLRRHTHFALVIDEYGALQGLITLEDILEEIVGEITDELDVRKDRAIEKTETGDYLVDGTLAIRTLNRALDWDLPDDKATTMAGLVIHEARMIPEAGAVFDLHKFRVEVVGKEGNRLTRLRVRPLGSDSSPVH
ncbi:MAG: HlyC/CorC family transporter [Planctomycetes bacterium]|nr:HlyC/CorC family transporter [Planctomycetota bacterium]